MLGVFVALVFGRPAGIVAASWLAVRLGWCRLPQGVIWTGVLLVGLLGGIGFTMSIFIAALAISGEGLLAAAKAGVLFASAAAGIIGLVLGRIYVIRAKALATGPDELPSRAQRTTDGDEFAGDRYATPLSLDCCRPALARLPAYGARPRGRSGTVVGYRAAATVPCICGRTAESGQSFVRGVHPRVHGRLETFDERALRTGLGVRRAPQPLYCVDGTLPLSEFIAQVLSNLEQHPPPDDESACAVLYGTLLRFHRCRA